MCPPVEIDLLMLPTVAARQDWYLGSSWALGIPTLGGVPYMNGRNQESSSEAVNAYYAVALYGHVMAQVRVS